MAAGLAAPLAAAIVAAVLLGGCGGDERREDVEAYIRDVNAIEQEVLISLSHASAAYRDFTTDEKELVKLRPKLVAAERSMRRLDRRVGALQPPPEARRLHQLVRQLTRAQVGLADELQRSAVYLPGYTAALRPHDDHHHAFMAETLAAVWVQTVWVQLPERLRPVATPPSAVPTLDIRAPQPSVTRSSPKRGSIRVTQPARIRSAKPSLLKKTTLAKPRARS